MNGPLLVFLGALCFSCAGTVQSFAPEGATPMSMAIIRTGGGAILLAGVCALRGTLYQLGPLRFWISPAALAASLGIFGFQTLFFLALSLVGVTVGTVVTIGVTPAAAGILGWLLLHERPQGLWYLATALAVFGVVMLAFAQGGSAEGAISVTGVVVAVAAGTSYALYMVSSKRIVMEKPPEVLIMGIFIIATLCTVLLLGVLPAQAAFVWLIQPAGVGVAVALMVLTAALPYVLTMTGLRSTPVSMTSTLALTEPLGAALLGIFFLGEPVSLTMFIGLGALFAGMALLIFPQKAAPQNSRQ